MQLRRNKDALALSLSSLIVVSFAGSLMWIQHENAPKRTDAADQPGLYVDTRGTMSRVGFDYSVFGSVMIERCEARCERGQSMA